MASRVYSSLVRYPHGGIQSKSWIKDSKYHNPDGPARIDYYDSGHKMQEMWMIEDQYHRLDGPAFIRYYLNGRVQLEEWVVKGKPHRFIYPSVMHLSKDGSVSFSSYYKFGMDITGEVKEYLRENEISDPFKISSEHSIIMKMKFW